MERKRIAGRFCKDTPGAEGELGWKPLAVGTAPRPRYCRAYTRKRVAEALPEIVEVFLNEATKGSVQHAKALTELGGLHQAVAASKVKRERGPGLATMLLRELEDGKAGSGL